MRAHGAEEYRPAVQISLLVESRFGEGDPVESLVVLRDGNGIVLSLDSRRVVAV